MSPSCGCPTPSGSISALSDHAGSKKIRATRPRADLKAGFSIPLRPLPQSFDAEKALLGPIHQSPSSVIDECVTRQTTAGHFLNPAHALILSTLLDMHGRRMSIDWVSLTPFLTDAGQLDNAGGAILVTDHFRFVPTPANAGSTPTSFGKNFSSARSSRSASNFTRRSYEEAGEVRLLLGEFESEADARATRSGRTNRLFASREVSRSCEMEPGQQERHKRVVAGITGVCREIGDLRTNAGC